jgi:hypothetical protein
MAQVGVFEAGAFKHGDPISSAIFQQVLWDRDKREYLVPLSASISSNGAGIYSPVFAEAGAHGTIEVSAPGFRANRFTMLNSDPYHEVWLSR